MATLNGSDLMVFAKINGKYQSIAYATSHSLSVTRETVDSSTKDNGNGQWSTAEKGMASWEMSTSNLMASEAENGLSFNSLFDEFLKGTEVELIFSLQTDMAKYESADTEFFAPTNGWTPDETNCYKGKAIITSLNVTAENGQKANYEATFTGCSQLLKVGNGIQKKNN